jgi:hypothetical protein
MKREGLNVNDLNVRKVETGVFETGVFKSRSAHASNCGHVQSDFRYVKNPRYHRVFGLGVCRYVDLDMATCLYV